MHLSDINVLIAIGDPKHVHHQRTRKWFLSAERQAWATCPITENGFIRILGQPSYPDFGGSPEDARQVLDALTTLPGHQFWPDTVSVLNQTAIPKLAGSKHLTDLYLLALAVERKGSLVTLDERINPSLLPGGPQAYYLIPA